MDEEEIRRRTVESTYATWRRQAGWHPLVIARAEGSSFWDPAGHRYLDFSSQLVASNLGHGNAAVTAAITEQAQKLPFVAPGFATEARAQLSKALDSVLPTELNRYFFSTSGTEANEAALKIARAVTHRSKVIARYRSYHGATAASMSVTGDFRRRSSEAVQKVPGTVFAPDCYCYRCPFGLRYPDCGVACADYVDYQLEHEGDVAAMILEPIV